MKKLLLFLLVIGTNSVFAQFAPIPVYAPREYVCYKVKEPILIDGVIDGAEWRGIPWTDNFVDIEGDKQPLPYRSTKAKIAWDDTFLYVAAELEEPHLWANLTERESVIFHDNDFEIFIDPQGSTHSYFEFEINALGTEWDLFLNAPYRDRGNFYLNGWNINGLCSAVKCYGTLNDPSDTDEKWCVEVAIPWSSIVEVRSGRKMYRAGEYLKMNFSRVQWETKIEGGNYVKCANPRTGGVNEYNWVWSPQGEINMHAPEMWAVVMLSDGGDYVADKDDATRWKLRCLYRRQREFFELHKRYADKIEMLQPLDIFTQEEVSRLTIGTTRTTYEISYADSSGRVWSIFNNGRVVSS